MTLEEIIKILIDALPENIRTDISFKKILKTFINVSVSKSENTYFYFEINDRILKDHELLSSNENVYPIQSDCTIFSVSTDISVNTFISVSKNKETFAVEFSSISIKDDNIEETVEIALEITKEKVTWIIHKFDCLENDYFDNYSIDIHEYDLEGKELRVINLEERIDDEFSKVFHIPLDKSREYRLNFNNHKDFLNETRINTVANLQDEMYGNKHKLFTLPFDINYLTDFLLDDLIDDENDDEEISEKLEKAEYIEETLIRFIGNIGEFTMTMNLCTNLKAFLDNKIKNLNTSGLIIRKLNNEYTSFYLYFNGCDIFVIPKPLSKEEALELYHSHEFNEYIYNLDEFFGITKKYKLDPNE